MACHYFTTVKKEIDQKTTVQSGPDSFTILMNVGGNGVSYFQEEATPFRLGDTILLPANLRMAIDPGDPMTVLVIEPTIS